MTASGIIITIITSVFGSGGFWAFITFLINKRSSTRQMILGIGYERLVDKCEYYIHRGYIPVSEYEDMLRYLYEPYRKMGGNGTAEALMKKVANLPHKAPRED